MVGRCPADRLADSWPSGPPAIEGSSSLMHEFAEILSGLWTFGRPACFSPPQASPPSSKSLPFACRFARCAVAVQAVSTCDVGCRVLFQSVTNSTFIGFVTVCFRTDKPLNFVEKMTGKAHQAGERPSWDLVGEKIVFKFSTRQPNLNDLLTNGGEHARMRPRQGRAARNQGRGSVGPVHLQVLP